MVIASRVPDPGLNPVALRFGGLVDNLMICSSIFSMTFPITESSRQVKEPGPSLGHC